MANAGRPRSTNVKTEVHELKDVVKKVGGLVNTVFTQKDGILYTGQYLVNQLPTATSQTDFVTSVTLSTYRITGSYLFDLDSSKTVMIVKEGRNISLFQYNSGASPTLISTLTASVNNAEVYLEAIFSATEKAAITGYSKYAFLNLPGEAWVVAYNTRIGNWQIEKVNNTYSAWSSGASVAKGVRRIPSPATGYYYEVTVAGITGGAPPIWPTTLGDTVTDGTVTWICRGRYIDGVGTGFPTTTSSSVKTLNGYIFVCVAGDIYNSDLDLPDSWNTTDFISTEIYPDPVVALGKYKNYLVAFGENTIEFFYDAANTSGSPLARQEGIIHNIGCIGQAAVCELEDRLFWISQSGSTYYSVWEMDKFEAKKISPPEFDNVLTNAFIVSTSYDLNVTKWQTLFACRINGRFFLGIPVLNKLTSNPAITNTVYFMDMELNVISTFNVSNSNLLVCRPCVWRNYFLWATTVLPVPPAVTPVVVWSVLAVNGYDITFFNAVYPFSYFDADPWVYIQRQTFNSNNYKYLTEIQVNPIPGVAVGGNYWYISEDRQTPTQLAMPQGGYKVHRCGRAREFIIAFRGNYELSQITFKYVEHSN